MMRFPEIHGRIGMLLIFIYDRVSASESSVR